ncbi:MAG: NUDIX domain-containing protein [Dehalococcoidia bacterium]
MKIRQSARLIILDPQHRLLLMKIDDNRVIDRARPNLTEFWITLGGGLEAGETFVAAAQRELWEETGIQDAAIGPCLWKLEQEFSFSGELVHSVEHYFLVLVPSCDVTTERLFGEELKMFRDHRWWSMEEMEQTDEVFLPFGFYGLVELLTPVLAGNLPKVPMDVTSHQEGARRRYQQAE